MWGIGLRAKFFVISFLALLFSTLSVTGILLAYFRAERISYLDNQIREVATSIIESKLSELKNYDDEEAELLISEELGPLRIGKFFVVRSSSGETLFETQNLSLLEVELPQSPQWASVQTDTHYLRVLNLSPSKYKSRTLQVGIIVDSEILSLSYLSSRTYAMVAGILVLTFVLTWIVSYVLFSPIGHLAQYLQRISKSLQAGQEVEVYRDSDRALFTSQNPKDEFRRLEKAIGEMSQRLNEGRRFMKSWTWQMAHELKTPLAILNRDLEILVENYGINEGDRSSSFEQIRKISETITSFLNWSQLNQAKNPGELFVIDPSEILKSLAMDLNKIYHNRIQSQIESGGRIIINPLHFEQAVRNLLENALKYSEKKVDLLYRNNKISVVDRGPGLSPQTLASLGQPFNRGVNSNGGGLGLGLAWVKTICEVYKIPFQLEYQEGCVAVIDLTNLTFEEQNQTLDEEQNLEG